MNNDSPHILLVDDDITLCNLIGEYLQGEGFQVSSAHDGPAAIARIEAGDIDLVVLDIMMPKMSGLDVLRRLQSGNPIAVIMLTGRGDEVDRIVGLELGADDYIAKPCNPRELSARIKAVLRRTQPAAPAYDQKIQALSAHGLHLDSAKLTVEFNNEPVNLTSAEFHVLKELMASIGKAITKAELTEKVLHRPLTAHDRSIDVHVSRVRQKLKQHGVDNVIKSIRGVGYQMPDEPGTYHDD